MYRTCPKCGHTRDDPAPVDRCPGCGLIFAKYLKTRYRSGRRPQVERSAGTAPVRRFVGALAEAVRWDGRPVDSLRFWGQVALWVLFAGWGLRLVWMDLDSNALGGSFMHVVNLMFHEAGHAVFRPFGEFMTILGGSLLQLIVPLVVVGAFLVTNRDPFAASFGLWWAGVSLMDVAVYINDARAMTLTLLGGGTGQDRPGMHDWNNLLGWLGLLPADTAIAWTVDVAGEATVLTAIAWGGWVLRQQQRCRV